MSIEGIKKAGAKTILLSMPILPALLFVGEMAFANKEDIAVLKKEEESIIRQLERIERKVDSIQTHLIQGE